MKCRQLRVLSKFVILFLLIVLPATNAAAITSDIGCSATIGKQDIYAYNGGPYSKIAYAYSYSQSLTINQVGFYRYGGSGTSKPYIMTIVNDNNGVPGSTVYATKSFYPDSTERGPQIVNLASPITLNANTRYWIVFDGSSVTSANALDFTVVSEYL